jgi:hypothetical protein
MSGKTAKQTRRETRRIMRGYLEEFTAYLKPKPKWIPWPVWTWMQSKVLRVDMIYRKRQV